MRKPSQGSRFEAGLEAGIISMTGEEEEEAGKGLSKFGAWCFVYLFSNQLNDQNDRGPGECHMLKAKCRIDASHGI